MELPFYPPFLWKIMVECWLHLALLKQCFRSSSGKVRQYDDYNHRQQWKEFLFDYLSLWRCRKHSHSKHLNSQGAVLAMAMELRGECNIRKSYQILMVRRQWHTQIVFASDCCWTQPNRVLGILRTRDLSQRCLLVENLVCSLSVKKRKIHFPI